MEENYANLGSRLAAIREAKGLSKAELSRKSGISEALLYRYESGRTEHLYIDTVAKLCMALDIGLGDLLGWHDDSDANAASTRINEEALKNVYVVPVFTKFVGDPPVPFGESAGSVSVYDPTVKSASEFIAIKIESDILLSEDIFPGDVLIIKRQDKVTVDRIVAVIIDSEIEFRRLQLERDGVMVYKLDSNEPPIKFDFQSMADKSIQIIGECVQIIRGAWYWKNKKKD